jgi:hypothetical protein
MSAGPHLDLPYEWTAHPVRDKPARGVLAAILIVFCGVLVAMIVDDPLVGPFAAGGSILFLLLTLNRFFLPTRYRIDERGVSARFPLAARALTWAEIRRFPHDGEGGYVSPRDRGGALDTRGISLLFAGRGRDIIPLIESHRPT